MLPIPTRHDLLNGQHGDASRCAMCRRNGRGAGSQEIRTPPIFPHSLRGTTLSILELIGCDAICPLWEKRGRWILVLTCHAEEPRLDLCVSLGCSHWLACGTYSIRVQSRGRRPLTAGCALSSRQTLAATRTTSNRWCVSCFT